MRARDPNSINVALLIISNLLSNDKDLPFHPVRCQDSNMRQLMPSQYHCKNQQPLRWKEWNPRNRFSRLSTCKQRIIMRIWWKFTKMRTKIWWNRTDIYWSNSAKERKTNNLSAVISINWGKKSRISNAEILVLIKNLPNLAATQWNQFQSLLQNIAIPSAIIQASKNSQIIQI